MRTPTGSDQPFMALEAGLDQGIDRASQERIAIEGDSLGDRFAQRPAIRRRLGELVNSTQGRSSETACLPAINPCKPEFAGSGIGFSVSFQESDARNP